MPLPVDPDWKRDYAASVRRLIRDGVDVPLANLFVHAARIPAAETEGEARARSASEAFFYRRLQSLPETTNRFRVNVELPIPFDNLGHMEVDFFCEETGIVIELDGAQHLSDADAYRRDRRKDALLQQRDISCCDFSRRTSGNIWIWFWIRFSRPSSIGRGNASVAWDVPFAILEFPGRCIPR